MLDQAVQRFIPRYSTPKRSVADVAYPLLEPPVVQGRDHLHEFVVRTIQRRDDPRSSRHRSQQWQSASLHPPDPWAVPVRKRRVTSRVQAVMCNTISEMVWAVGSGRSPAQAGIDAFERGAHRRPCTKSRRCRRVAVDQRSDRSHARSCTRLSVSVRLAPREEDNQIHNLAPDAPVGGDTPGQGPLKWIANALSAPPRV